MNILKTIADVLNTKKPVTEDTFLVSLRHFDARRVQLAQALTKDCGVDVSPQDLDDHTPAGSLISVIHARRLHKGIYENSTNHSYGHHTPVTGITMAYAGLVGMNPF